LNVDPRESDLAKASESEMKTELFPGIDFTYLTEWREFRRREQTAMTNRGSLTHWLLVATFCLIFVEQLMAWRFYFGFLLLYAVVAAGFVHQVMLTSMPWATLLAVVLTAGFAVIVYLGRRRALTA